MVKNNNKVQGKEHVPKYLYFYVKKGIIKISLGLYLQIKLNKLYKIYGTSAALARLGIQ